MKGYQIKVVLEDVKPPVWRRIVIPEQVNFRFLHEVIQIAFGWEDMHLHEFQLSESEIVIGCIENADLFMLSDENSMELDGFLCTHKWIRYIYDFGDNWRHKITFEKEVPDYDKRYATIVKSVGNNMEEDCGGVYFCEDANQSVFDLKKINEQLHKHIFSLEEAEKLTSVPTQYEATKKFLDETEKYLEKLLNKIEKSVKKQKIHIKNLKTKETQEVQKLMEFFEKREEFFLQDDCEIRESRENMYEQLTLPGIVLEEEQNKKGYFIECEQGNSTMQDNLAQLDIKMLRDYCKYLGLDAGKKRRKGLSQLIVNYLREFPEKLCYIFQPENMVILRKLGEHRNAFTDADVYVAHETVMLLKQLGLVETKLVKTSEKHVLTLQLAVDFKDIVGLVSEDMALKTEEYLTECRKRISQLLRLYGMISLEELYAKYVYFFDDKITKEELWKVVYWYLRMHGYVVTFSDMNGECFVTTENLDITRTSGTLYKYGDKVEYYPYTKADLELLKEDGEGINPCFHEMYAYFRRELDEEVADIYIEEFAELAWTGEPADGLDEFLEELGIGSDEIVDFIDRWRMCLNICLHTHLPALKGYTRVEYGKKMGVDPFEIEVLNAGFLLDTIDCDTCIIEMPLPIQKELYGIMERWTDVDIYKDLERFTKKLNVENYEILTVLCMAYMNAGKLSKAQKALERIEKLGYWDDSLEELWNIVDTNMGKTLYELQKETGGSDLFYDEDWRYDIPQQTTVVRQGKKVGRNDPCPCGSGKKYKKCCGKNQ